jgi:membrane dipeptidase
VRQSVCALSPSTIRHADTPQRFLDEGFDIGSTDPNDVGHISLDKARRGNLGAEFFSIWVEPETSQGQFARHTFDLIDSVYQQAARHPDRMMMAFSVADIERAHREHKLAALMGIEGGHSIETDIRLLRDYYRLGVRYMTLTWSNTNEWADSSGDIDDPKLCEAPQALTAASHTRPWPSSGWGCRGRRLSKG